MDKKVIVNKQNEARTRVKQPAVLGKVFKVIMIDSLTRVCQCIDPTWHAMRDAFHGEQLNCLNKVRQNDHSCTL
jgi:hypothetical protein